MTTTSRTPRTLRPWLAGLFGLLMAATAAAQTQPPPVRRPAPPPPPPRPPKVAVRAFVLISGEAFSASKTFDTAFGGSFQPMFGGGLELVFRSGLYTDVSLSFFSKTGQRGFVSDTGQVFRTGIPLDVSLTPIEFTGGYRIRLRRHPKWVPYLGAGVGWYLYKESSPGNDASENVDTSHAGFLAVGGAGYRIQKHVELAGDGQFTYVPGILGTGGVSKGVGENNLGGIAARFRVVIVF
jgi:opacity protein-like surface antigen